MATLNETHGAEIEHLYVDCKLSTPAIGDKLNISAPAARNVLLARGVQMRSRGRSGRRPEVDIFKGPDLDKVKKLLEAGANMVEVARQMGVSPPTIRRYAKRLGLH